MSATISYLRNHKYNGIDDIEHIKNDFNKVNIKISYDSKITNGKRKVIFTSTKGMRSQKFDKIIYECNGLVLEAPTWKPLSVPCPTPKTSVKNEIFNKLLNKNQYQIYKISDGTLVYLYFWNGIWYISTARGLDMEKVKLNGYDYNKLFNDILNKYSITFENFTDLLDKKYSYSFVIRHSAIHPFTVEDELIFVHKIRYNNSNININRSNHDLPLNIPCQEKITDESKLHEIYSSLSTSLHSWLSTKQNPLFGYLFISTELYKVGGDHSCVLLESSLMRQIRHFVYDKKYMDFGEYRELSIIINGFLSPQKHIFIQLFPQYQSYFTQLETIQTELADNILKTIMSNNTELTNENINIVNANPVDYLSSIIKKTITLNTNDEELSKKHINGIINDTSYTRLYIQMLNN
jgi:hypothetical protein